MLRTLRIRRGWRMTLCVFLICWFNFDGGVVKAAEISSGV